MSIVSTTTKARVGAKAARTAVKNPGILKAGAGMATPVARLGAKVRLSIARRRARRRIDRFGHAARELGQNLVTYGPQAALELGLVEAPKRKRTAPRVAAGVVLGAGAMYLLEPDHGREHREKLMSKVA